MTSTSSTLVMANVTIGVLTALKEEYIACQKIFDPDNKGKLEKVRATSGLFECWLCAIPANDGGHHVVAISRLPGMGNVAAAIGANILLQHCTNTTYLIMCGIAGAVPNPVQPENHVRLGDIVVCDQGGIFRYDRGKQHDPQTTAESRSLRQRALAWMSKRLHVDVSFRGNPFEGFSFRGPPRAPHHDLLSAVERIHSEELLLGRHSERKWESMIKSFLARVENPDDWKRPVTLRDILIDSPAHGALATPHPDDALRRTDVPRVFHGPIGAADVVQADPRRRDFLRDRHAVKAIEMEGSGIADACWVANIGYLVIRGTCDYCNSRKNNDWHHYAALAAAAYTRTVVEYLHSIVNQPKLPHADQLQDGSDSPRQSDYDTIRQLVDTIERLMKEWRWPEIRPLAEQLENILHSLPRRGSDVRSGWLILARLELNQVQELQLTGRPIDLTRQRQLRAEVESVTD